VSRAFWELAQVSDRGQGGSKAAALLAHSKMTEELAGERRGETVPAHRQEPWVLLWLSQ
jgi:hypothetical protein